VTMLIDMNAYLGHWPFRKLRHNTAPELVALQIVTLLRWER